MQPGEVSHTPIKGLVDLVKLFKIYIFLTLSNWGFGLKITRSIQRATQELVLGRKKDNKGKETVKEDKEISSLNILETIPSSSKFPPKTKLSKPSLDNKPKPFTIKSHPIFTMNENELNQETTVKLGVWIKDY